MTIEMRSYGLLGKAKETVVLEPGQCIVMESHVIPYRPSTHIQIVSPDEIEIIKQYPEDNVQKTRLIKTDINKSEQTSTFLGGFKIVWTPS